MANVQFFGLDRTVEAYEFKEVDTWAICQGKMFIQSGSGPDELRQFLDMLSQDGAAAVYTLRVYRNVQPDAITDKTECHGSFNFKLTERAGGATAAVAGAVKPTRTDYISNLVSERVTEHVANVIDKKFERLLEMEEEERQEKSAGIGNIIADVFTDPNKLAGFVGLVKSMFSQAAPASIPASLAGVGAPAAPGQTERPADLPPQLMQQQERLVTVINRLEKADPEILRHLEGLANLAEKNPQFFKMLLTQLDNGL